MRFTLRSVVLVLLVANGDFAFSATTQDALVASERLRLEELFISKMSEELKLPSKMESSFAEAIRALNREKTKANLEVANSLVAIDQAQNGHRSAVKRATEKAVKRYEKAWRAYGQLPIREVARLRSILGSERLGRYLVAKSQMADKLKALSTREVNEAAEP